ncbi:MAG TPA: twin-arginine translocase TatA/TatE family subunit [Smithella sp.]|nr:twin-arginine translocase TatA/TatE family subunit [Smithella sp.]
MFEGIFQPMHLIIILIIVLIIFGPGKLPELGGSIGKAIRGFKKAMEEPDKKPDETAQTRITEEPVKKPDEAAGAKKMEDKKD